MSAIAHIRKNVLKVSQEALAGMCCVSQATVSRWEKGELSPNLRELSAIRDAGREAAPDDWDDSWLFERPDASAASEPAPIMDGAAA